MFINPLLQRYTLLEGVQRAPRSVHDVAQIRSAPRGTQGGHRNVIINNDLSFDCNRRGRTADVLPVPAR